MRKLFIAGNWKMHLNRAQSVALAAGVAQRVGTSDDVEVAICPVFPYLEAVVAAVKGSVVGVGAQNMHHESTGAFTGEVAGPMLLDIGCKYVILGHSERRQCFGGARRSLRAQPLVRDDVQQHSGGSCIGPAMERVPGGGG